MNRWSNLRARAIRWLYGAGVALGGTSVAMAVVGCDVFPTDGYESTDESGDSVGRASGRVNALVDLNSGTADEFDSLPYVTPAQAAAIVAYREQYGAFEAIEEVTMVPGIGVSTFNRIKAAIKVTNAAPDTSDPAYRVAINDASQDAIAALPTLTAELAGLVLSYRTQFGFFASTDELANVSGFGAGNLEATRDRVTARYERVYFSPKSNESYGHAPVNQLRTVLVRKATDATVEPLLPSLSNATVDLMRRAERKIQIAMYSFRNNTPEFAAVKAAAERGVQIEMFLDASEKDPVTKLPYTEGAVTGLQQFPNVKAKYPKYASKMMHQKFGIIDDKFVFNGSANFSSGATEKYDESRFIFVADDEVLPQFQAEWSRLWNQLGKWRLGQ